MWRSPRANGAEWGGYSGPNAAHILIISRSPDKDEEKLITSRKEARVQLLRGGVAVKHFVLNLGINSKATTVFFAKTLCVVFTYSRLIIVEDKAPGDS